ncbi:MULTISPECIES: flagellar assembly protein FliX [unclassified Pseudovibrio]|uniref:flagellar assembly protein FliX n=1 Tax=unclassified Pseudovibrio TaxID=2627060 RepID=UPI0007AEBFA2|nr:MULTISPECIES: flagellar assembly protein FliX [unclassified Pseudovibrio]KZK93187.1 Flagellar assembly protein FliX [Pseudovibrio sp. W74]KZL07078.1 Flagellar assembly protein FliX [Pseudovibrio sp. Ad14]
MLVRSTPVSGLNSTSKVGTKRRKGSEGEQAGAFAVEEETTSVVQSQAGVPTPSLQGVDSLLALQQMEVQVDDKQRAVQHGNKLLDQLDALRIDLLQGKVQPERLERLVGNLSMQVKSGNPGLDRVVEDIELRARIELAKLGHYVE